MLRNLTIHCPPMGVTNTGWFFQPTADRITDNLLCPSSIEGIGDFNITFPPCRVYYVSLGKWMVEPVIAWGVLPNDSGTIRISYPEEPILREGKYLFAQQIASIDSDSYVVTLAGVRYPIKSVMPMSKATPQGLLGSRKFIVEAVDITGTVDW